jgi:hypothetical protein
VWRTLVNLDIKDFLLFVDFLSIASLALILFVDDFALSSAFVARSSRLTVHAWSNHLHLRYHTFASALTTLLDSSVFTASAFAGLADTITVHCYFCGFTGVNLFKRELNWVLDWFGLFWTFITAASATHTEKATKNIVHSTRMSPTLF